jgi:hypothetical protein
MLPITHAKYASAAAIVLLPVLKRNVPLFWLAAIFIDVDHYIWYVLKHRDLNPWNAYHCLREITTPSVTDAPPTHPLVVFHTVEVLVACSLLAFRWSWSTALFLGMAFHMALDVIDDLRTHSALERRYFWFIPIDRLWRR